MSWFKKIWDEMNRPLSQCAMCKGTGRQQIGHLDRDCPFCEGTGQNKLFNQDDPAVQFGQKTAFRPNRGWPFNKCDDCEGSGWVYISSPNSIVRGQKRQACAKCQGKGRI